MLSRLSASQKSCKIFQILNSFLFVDKDRLGEFVIFFQILIELTPERWQIYKSYTMANRTKNTHTGRFKIN